jgi:hypothetical protein
MSDAKHYLNTKELGQLVGLHPYRVSGVFGAALVGRRGPAKIYALQQCAAIIAKASGHPISPNLIGELIPRSEAMKMLAAVDRGRCRRTWCYWQDNNVGPTPYRLGGRIKYLRHQVYAWVEYMSALPDRSTAIDWATTKLALHSEKVPMAESSAALGLVGGSLHFSCSGKGEK